MRGEIYPGDGNHTIDQLGKNLKLNKWGFDFQKIERDPWVWQKLYN